MLDLNYVDNIAILRESFADIQSAIDEMQTHASKIGMKVNAQKTKLLTVGFLQTKKQTNCPR